MLATETGAVFLLILLALAFPRLGKRWFDSGEARFRSFAARRGFSVFLAGVLGLGARIAVLPILPVPQPGYGDEFGHLLAGDTFAHGRIANPPHPMWIHLENLAGIQHPTYASKYPPGQGLVLAAGQVLFGHAFWGVCLSIGLMCAAICWMLQGWVAPHWALLGAILAVIRLAMFSYWANSYWGGAVAACGGALVLGALPRLNRASRGLDAWIMGCGFMILAISRPYEGFVVSLLASAFLIYGLLAAKEGRLRRAAQVALPIAVCLVVLAAGLGYYNWRTTGKPLLTPYQLCQNTYYSTPLFFWQAPRPTPAYRHSIFRDQLRRWELAVYTTDHEHPILSSSVKALHFWLFYFGPALTAPFIALLYTLPYHLSWTDFHPDTRALIFIIGVSLGAFFLALFFNPGYAAPLTAAIYLLVIKALRRLRSSTGNRLSGVAISRAIVLACVVLVGVRALAGPLRIAVTRGARTWCSRDFRLTERANIESALAGSGRKHLVIVRYPDPDTGVVIDWVSNDADIDSSKVVWAHDMGPQHNEELTRYFKDREVWIVEAQTARITRYPGQAPQIPLAVGKGARAPLE